MRVIIDGTSQTMGFEDVDNLKELSLTLRGRLEDCVVAMAASGVVHDRDHGWIDIAVLRSAGSASSVESWPADFDAMVEYADHRGWTNADRTALRAHIVAGT